MQAYEIALWAMVLVLVMACTCWRVVAQRLKGRRCTEAVRGECEGSADGTWVHGDAGDEAALSRPVYRYEFRGKSYVSAGGVPTMLFWKSPTARMAGEPVELRVNPADPTEVYDPAYERWFARYRMAWGVAAFVGCFALVSLLNIISFG